jgi:hypothetical protein
VIRWHFGSAQLQVDAPVAGDRAYARFVKGKSNRYLRVTARATLTVTSAVSAILGLGSLWQAFDYIGIDEGGKDFQIDPRLMLALTESLSQSARTKTRVTSLSASPVALVEQIDIPFEYVNGGKPGETRFRESALDVDTRFFYVLNGTANGLAKLVTGGTATLTNVTVTVEQFYDNDLMSEPPLFKPSWMQKRLPVTGTNTALALDVNVRDLVGGITILQNTTGKGMVTDIINKFGMSGATQDFFGRGQLLNYDEFARGMEAEYGGDVYASAKGGVVHINFRQSGRLSNALNPNQDNTIQLLFDAQESAVSGAVTSEILVLFHLLTRNAVQRKGDGVWVTNPVLPKNLAA